MIEKVQHTMIVFIYKRIFNIYNRLVHLFRPLYD